jgi:hypothetical protein
MLASGVNWGLAEVPFQADDEPARDVLRRLIRLERLANSQAPNRHPDYDHWTVGCDGRAMVLHRSPRQASASVPMSHALAAVLGFAIKAR